MGVVWPAERKPSRVGRLHGNGSYYWDFHLREVSLANLHLKDLFGITLLVGDFVVLGDTWDSRLGRRLLDNVDLVELSPTVLARALEPFPVSVRTLDGLHLATVEFLRSNGSTVELASYDTRIITAAKALGIAIRPL